MTERENQERRKGRTDKMREMCCRVCGEWLWGEEERNGGVVPIPGRI